MKTYGRKMEEVPFGEWPFFPNIETEPLRVWRSSEYLAVLYRQRADGLVRLTVNSVRRKREGKRKAGTDWRDGITWDELQRIKNETLGEDVWCVEVYPAQDALVDVANMRHLWPLDEPPATRFPTKPVVSDRELKDITDLLRGLRSLADPSVQP